MLRGVLPFRIACSRLFGFSDAEQQDGYSRADYYVLDYGPKYQRIQQRGELSGAEPAGQPGVGRDGVQPEPDGDATG